MFLIFVRMDNKKKYFILGALFILPLVAYMFFASGVNNFIKLPKLNDVPVRVGELESIDGEKLRLKGNISILSFFGRDIDTTKVLAFNLKEKIYDKNKDFKDLQFISFISPGYKDEISSFKYEINKTSDAYKWKFVELEPDRMKSVFDALGSDKELSQDLSSDHAFIVGKDGFLRGRKDDEDEGIKYSYDMSSVAELDNKMEDDVKIILAEYRLALKKNNKYK